MAEIVKEGRKYAASCRACGQFTSAEIIEGLCDWVEIQQASNRADKQEIRELRRLLPNDAQIVRLVGGRNYTKGVWKDKESEGT